MPMTTEVCKKHGAYYAEKCPTCVYEEYKALSDASKEFFKKFGGVIVLAETVTKEKVTTEDIYQYFRIRLLEELEPILSKMSQQAREQFETAYYAAARR